ncbi:hypothetical protein A1F94_013837 [Pyrenophora tritici-repentis]|nr:hypothetical protein A1F94_013837 [Pyrenophora tritici-repentis]
MTGLRGELDFNDIDSTYFVLMVDLWNQEASAVAQRPVSAAARPAVRNNSHSAVRSTVQNDDAHAVIFAWPVMGYPYLQPGPPASYPAYAQTYGQPPQAPIMPPAPMSSNHTRNLIGMNAVNACRLNDLDGKAGFCLFDIGSGTNTVVPESQGPTHGKGPCLAHSFSEQFTVYSAKKFPGVIESTPLSKCFAQQGIKIPIRKDAPKEIVNANEYEADD